MDFSPQEIKKFEGMDKLVQNELSKLNIPQSDLNGMVHTVCSFHKEHSQLEEDNHSVFYILLLAATYKAGRESVAKALP